MFKNWVMFFVLKKIVLEKFHIKIFGLSFFIKKSSMRKNFVKKLSRFFRNNKNLLLKIKYVVNRMFVFL